jgi:hypothetical protein
MDIQRLFEEPQPIAKSGKNPISAMALRAGDRLTASVLDVDKGFDALLSIGPYKAYARLPLPVVTGQKIQIRVVAEGGALRMVMVPAGRQAAHPQHADQLTIRLFEPLSGRPLLSDHAQLLASGTPIRGRITGFEKDGRMLVDFGKFKAFAKIDIPVRQGQIISLTVVKNDSGVTFAVSPKTHAVSPNLPDQSAAVTPGTSSPPTAPEIADLRKHIQQMLDRATQTEKTDTLSPPTSMKGALINLQQALNPASPTGDMPALVARIKEFVDNSGIYFEKRLGQAIAGLQNRSASMTPADLMQQPIIRDLIAKDMKPNLLILKGFLDRQPSDAVGADRHMLETLKSMVQRVVSHIDQQQLAATQKPMDTDLFQVFSHLIFLTDTQRSARFKVYYAKKGREDAHKHPRVSLLLEMDRMGTVRADLWMVDRDLNITFFVQDDGAKTAIQNNHHHVTQMLENTFDTISISVVVNEKKVAEFEGEALSLPNRRQVDLKI